MVGSWTCRQCLSQADGSRIGFQARSYAKKSTDTAYTNGAKPRRKGRVVAAAAVGGLGVTGLAFGDDVKHAYKAVERSGRVVSTLAVNINE